MDTIALQSVRWRAVGLFVAVAMGAAFALDAVCALTGGLGTPLSYALLAVRMFSPALASWVVCRFVTGEPWLRAVGLRRPAPGGRGRVLTSARWSWPSAPPAWRWRSPPGGCGRTGPCPG